MAELQGKGSRQTRKKCVKQTAYPCKFSCILKAKKCRNAITGAAKTAVEWLSKVGATIVQKVKDTRNNLYGNALRDYQQRRRAKLDLKLKALASESYKQPRNTIIDYVPENRSRKAIALRSDIPDQQDRDTISRFSDMAYALSKQQEDERLAKLLRDSSGIWDSIDSEMTGGNTLIIRSDNRIESAAQISSDPDDIYVEYLATHPINVLGGEGAVSGAGKAALVSVARRAYAQGKGFHLSALSSAIPFYRKIGMTEISPGHFQVEKDNVMDFIINNTRKKK